MVLPYQIIHQNNFVAIKINPVAYEIKIFRKKLSKLSNFAINSNYYWNNNPIGLLKDYTLFPYIDKYSNIRPVFLITEKGVPSLKVLSNASMLSDYSLASQAGPWLINAGKIVYPLSLKEGHFQLDVSRVTKHTALGITEFGKIILYYNSNTSLSNMAFDLQKLGCTYAMNMDGGSSSSLKVNSKQFGNPYPHYGIEFFVKKK